MRLIWQLTLFLCFFVCLNASIWAEIHRALQSHLYLSIIGKVTITDNVGRVVGLVNLGTGLFNIDNAILT
jgi:hypothetical protein